MTGMLTPTVPDANPTQPSEGLAEDQNWLRWAIVAAGTVAYIFAVSIVTSRMVSIFDVSLWIAGSSAPAIAIGLHRMVERHPSNRGISNSEMIGVVGWSASIVAFVLLRKYFLSDYFEAGIYDSFDPTLMRYMLLSAIYTMIGYAVALLVLFAAGRRPLRDHTFLVAAPLGFAGSAVFFCLMVFYAPYLVQF
jgi:hypothetical protein